MANKMYKKADLTFVDGLLFNKENEAICLSSTIVSKFNRLEFECQKKGYEDAVAKIREQQQVEIPKFEFQSNNHRCKLPKVSANTATLDEAINKSINLMHDIDTCHDADKINEAIQKYAELFEFVEKDYVIDLDGCPKELDVRFDILSLDKEHLVSLIIGSVIGGVTQKWNKINGDECEDNNDEFDDDEFIDKIKEMAKDHNVTATVIPKEIFDDPDQLHAILGNLVDDDDCDNCDDTDCPFNPKSDTTSEDTEEDGEQE